jgi:hypothetical protein
MARTLRSERTLSKEHLRALGVLAFEAAGLEVLVSSWRNRLMGGSSTAGFERQLEDFRKALNQKAPAHCSEVDSLCDRAKALMRQRNTAVHGKWAADLADQSNATATNREHSGKQVKAADLVRIATKISQCRRTIKRLGVSLRALGVGI